MSWSLGFCVRLCICASDSFLSIYCCARSSSKIYCGWIVDIVDIIWHGDCNDELLTGNIDVGRNMPIELALFGVWTINFWSHYHRLTSDCRRNELPSSNWEKKRRNKIWIRPRHFSVDFNFYIAAQSNSSFLFIFFLSTWFFLLCWVFFFVGYREVPRMRRTESTILIVSLLLSVWRRPQLISSTVVRCQAVIMRPKVNRSHAKQS